MAGYSYDIAENGEKAVELFKQKEYKAALFDVQMPVMDGLADLNYQTDPDMIDCYTYQLKGAYMRYKFLLKQVQKEHLKNP